MSSGAPSPGRARFSVAGDFAGELLAAFARVGDRPPNASATPPNASSSHESPSSNAGGVGDASGARSRRAPWAFGRSRDAWEAAPVLPSAPERAERERASSSRESASEAVSSSLSSRTLRIAAASLAFSTEALCVPARLPFFEKAFDVERPAFRLSAAAEASFPRVSFSSSFASFAASNSRSSASNSASSSSSRALFLEALLGADLEMTREDLSAEASAAGRVDERGALGAETNSPARFAFASSAARLCLSPRLRNGRGAADDAFAGGVFS
mmetsp:Transcript_9850/g.41895  ORF Transcript_9850/g.41895 Transcript_9850/m.41895 type:complete len:271 (+) Transcript_9850:56-868(+)